jgi:hypothetical protein
VKCFLCNREILPHEKCIRIIVEEVTRDEENDGGEAEYFSDIEDWVVLSGMHSDCVKNALRQGKEIPYIDAVKKLEVGKKAVQLVGQLRLVDSSAG